VNVNPSSNGSPTNSQQVPAYKLQTCADATNIYGYYTGNGNLTGSQNNFTGSLIPSSLNVAAAMASRLTPNNSSTNAFLQNAASSGLAQLNTNPATSNQMWSNYFLANNRSAYE